LVADTDELYSVLELGTRTTAALNASTDLALTDGIIQNIVYEFKILATAFGESAPNATKNVTLQINICGDEVLTWSDSLFDTQGESLEFAFTYASNEAPINLTQTWQDLISTNDSYCIVTTLALATNTSYPDYGEPTSDDLAVYNLTDESLVYNTLLPGEYLFYVYAETESGAYYFRPINITVYCTSDTQQVFAESLETTLLTIDKNSEEQLYTDE
jgi:hypothetical protein